MDNVLLVQSIGLSEAITLTAVIDSLPFSPTLLVTKQFSFIFANNEKVKEVLHIEDYYIPKHSTNSNHTKAVSNLFSGKFDDVIFLYDFKYSPTKNYGEYLVNLFSEKGISIKLDKPKIIAGSNVDISNGEYVYIETHSFLWSPKIKRDFAHISSELRKKGYLIASKIAGSDAIIDDEVSFLASNIGKNIKYFIGVSGHATLAALASPNAAACSFILFGPSKDSNPSRFFDLKNFSISYKNSYLGVADLVSNFPKISSEGEDKPVVSLSKKPSPLKKPDTKPMVPNKRDVLYTGALMGASGYAQFARNFVYGLNHIGADVCWNHASANTSQTPDLGLQKTKMVSIKDTESMKYRVQVINLTPPKFKRFASNRADKKVGFTMFEASRLPRHWVGACNNMDAILVPCQYNVDIFKESGVHKPIYVVPAGTNLPATDKKLPQLSGYQNKFIFYSIFQWTERKNPEGLIRAYISAFQGRKDVVLVLRTFVNKSSHKVEPLITSTIRSVVQKSMIRNPPEIKVISNLLSRDEVWMLHNTGDCFVLPHRSEGFGMPHIESMAAGNPTIATGFGGNTEFMNDENSYLVSHQPTIVYNMGGNGNYNSSMIWAEPNLVDLQEKMLSVFNNRKDAKFKGMLAQNHIRRNFSWDARAKKLKEVLDTIK